MNNVEYSTLVLLFVILLIFCVISIIICCGDKNRDTGDI